MVFTSVIYFLFLVCSLIVYYLLPGRFRNYFLIAISIFFYMYVKASYIFIISFIILANYFLGIQIDKSNNKKDRFRFLFLSLIINLGVLIFFKYWNFVVESIFNFAGIFHINQPIPTILEIALPLGLSYYIFQTIGYILDVYRGSIKAERSIFHFSLFTLYFPKLLVGPIERANHFLPQLKKNKNFENRNLVEGGKRVIWGLFKKLVVADRIAIYQTVVFTNYQEQSGTTLLFASILYTFQIYADFSGYTDIALGTSQMFGYNLLENFKRPLFAKNISDFWRRWHISLSSWVNDYIFNPLALEYRRWGRWAVYFALIISFTIIGIWHGASWNYVLFGLIQAMALIYETLTKKTRKKISKKTSPFIYNNLSIILTFLFVTFSLIVFRSDNLSDAIGILKGIFQNKGAFFFDKPSTILFILMGCGIMMLKEIQGEFKIFKFSLFSNQNWIVQQISYSLIIVYILLAGVFDGGQFIYFAF